MTKRSLRLTKRRRSVRQKEMRVSLSETSDVNHTKITESLWGEVRSGDRSHSLGL